MSPFAKASSVFRERVVGARKSLQRYRLEFDTFYSSAQARAQGVPHLLEGERLGALRDQLIDRPETRYRAGISNCGLVKVADGYLGVVKNNTYCFCRDHGIPSDYGPEDRPQRSELLRVNLDEQLRVRSASALRISSPGSSSDHERDLWEDARLCRIGERIVCSANLVPQGAQWLAMPALGWIGEASSEIVLRSAPIPGARPPQKNWIPFSFGDGLCVEYSINPHVVFRLEGPELRVVERYRTWFASGFWGPRGPFYRGGSSPILWDGHYLGAAHSMVLVNGVRNYRTHFYLTETSPPFRIRWFGKPVKLLRSERIQFISAVLPWGEDGLLLSYGMDDCDNVFAGVRAKDVMATLKKL